MQAVDCNAREVISHVVEEGLWPSYVLVVQVLLQRYGIHDLSQLQLSAPLPALLLLLDVNAKVDLFLGAYLAVPRGICTLVDLERDASAVLRSFSVASLRPSRPAVAPGPKPCDQNEIAIDNDDVDGDGDGEGGSGGGEEVVVCEGACISELDPLTFEWFGLGPLHRHPRVAALFSLSSEHVLLPPAQRLSSACVMRTLLAFRRQTSAPPLSAAALGSRCIAPAVALDWAAFSAYLLQTHRMPSLASAGVLLMGSGVSSMDGYGLEPGFGAAELVMLRHVEQAASRAMVQATKRQLENLQRGGSGVGVDAESLGLGLPETDKGAGNYPVVATSKRQRAAATAIVVPDSDRDRDGDRDGDGDTQPAHSSSASAIVPFAARLLQRFDTSSGGSLPQEELRVGHFGPEVLSPLCSLTVWAVGASGVAATNTPGQGHDLTHGGSDVLREVGRWGEALVYNFLLLQHPDATVEWVNRDAETRAPYDLILTLPPPLQPTMMKRREATTTTPNSCAAGSITVFVEVKSTRFSDLNVFDLSLSEWDFATRDTATRFHLYRVFNAGNPAAVRLARVQDVRRSVEAGSVRLCLAV